MFYVQKCMRVYEHFRTAYCVVFCIKTKCMNFPIYKKRTESSALYNRAGVYRKYYVCLSTCVLVTSTRTYKIEWTRALMVWRVCDRTQGNFGFGLQLNCRRLLLLLKIYKITYIKPLAVVIRKILDKMDWIDETMEYPSLSAQINCVTRIRPWIHRNIQKEREKARRQTNKQTFENKRIVTFNLKLC